MTTPTPPPAPGRVGTSGGEEFYGHASAEHLEYWLDSQVATEQLTAAQARMFLPSYEPPLTMTSPVRLDVPTPGHDAAAVAGRPPAAGGGAGTGAAGGGLR